MHEERKAEQMELLGVKESGKKIPAKKGEHC
ncbi:hypothetical protein J2S13_002332 [Oikeobacillus pervagus]|uniref:Uncharacterized protein n=1 Tax=Oikeobacillus pervagus TaxID=1325931 RepID=A0AAJ1WH75_9BACI|nr:hypothetical protein [Oikeobacillus pervagus]